MCDRHGWHVTKRSTGLAALAAAFAALWLAPAAAEPPSASALDNAEANVCMATSRLQGSVAAAVLDSRQAIPIEQLTGRIDNPMSRAQLQRELDNRVKQAQEEMVETNRRDLIRYQAEYRQLTGLEFDTGQCDGPRVRVTHAMRAQQQRQLAMSAQTAKMSQVLATGETYRQADIRMSEACDAKKSLDVPPQAAARLFPPGYVEKSRQVYGEFVSSYRREHGAPFDASRCR
jgi:hypothetical protein